jgi:NAD(P)-dependent dehydrogenase (short-subunit alcohol dehydrogenase family)
LGEAVARAFRLAGAKVALFDRDIEKGQALSAEIGALFCAVDVTSDDSVATGFSRARAAHGQERVLVNCAGIAASVKTIARHRETGEITPFPLELFSRIVAVNLAGTFRCLALSAEGMARLAPLEDGERGVIVNTASVAATDGQIGQTAYSASKAGIIGLTLPAARDLASEGIRVNTIAPGIMETPMMAGMPEAFHTTLTASVPFPRRLGTPEEFASLVLEIIRNRYINAETVRLDGAIRLAPR